VLGRQALSRIPTLYYAVLRGYFEPCKRHDRIIAPISWRRLRALLGLGWQIRTLATGRTTLAQISYQLASGQWRAVASNAALMMIFDPEAGRLEAEVRLPREFTPWGIPSLFESEDGRWCLAMFSREGVVYIWDLGLAPASTGALRSALKTG
jgi:hypothetical protein